MQETAYPGTKGWSALKDHHTIALLNLGETAVAISAHLPTVVQLWSQETSTGHGSAAGEGAMMARDVWQNKTLGAVVGDHLNTTVGPHEVRLFRVWRGTVGL